MDMNKKSSHEISKNCDKQQTAVTWLLDNLKGQLNIDEVSNIITQAKEMEKEQIEDAYWEGGQDVPMSAKQCKQYYEQTYGE